MTKLPIRQQKPSEGIWQDDNGNKIPYSRVSPLERKSERVLASTTKKAIALNTALTAFKSELKNQFSEMYQEFIKENNGKAPGKGKGGITFFNFDRSIKITLDINDRIELDEKYIMLAKEELNGLLSEALKDTKDWIEPIVMAAFETSGGRLDHRKVLALKRHATRINNPRFDAAMAFVDKAIRKPSSKEYYRIQVRDEQGEYHDVVLNFSALVTED
ncbi:MAG: DUF3164 family protein [Arcticibacter sp.]